MQVSTEDDELGKFVCEGHTSRFFALSLRRQKTPLTLFENGRGLQMPTKLNHLILASLALPYQQNRKKKKRNTFDIFSHGSFLEPSYQPGTVLGAFACIWGPRQKGEN